MTKLPISCFIIAQDEADRIARTIRSVASWMDEVIVVDSASSDDTVSVAKSAGARVITQAWLGFGAQKRFAEDQCRNDWAFNIDADEVITPELKQEIISLFANGPPPLVAYGMPVQIVYPGASKPRRWARDHWFVRLYDRRVVHFRESAVHDSVVTVGHQIGKLQAPMHHFSMRSFAHMKSKLNERSWLSVRHANSNGRTSMLPRLITELPMNFFKYYVARRHFTGGLVGLKYASLHSWYRFLKIYNIWRAGRDGISFGALDTFGTTVTRNLQTVAPANGLAGNPLESSGELKSWLGYLQSPIAIPGEAFRSGDDSVSRRAVSDQPSQRSEKH